MCQKTQSSQILIQNLWYIVQVFHVNQVVIHDHSPRCELPIAIQQTRMAFKSSGDVVMHCPVAQVNCALAVVKPQAKTICCVDKSILVPERIP
mmetsp:Transcript_3868/g.8530  ORF Transcript_3868/g.8530 Transcript_3868/m.8530 type:complete len:93 (-) Transcript_3868:19-297(-)